MPAKVAKKYRAAARPRIFVTQPVSDQALKRLREVASVEIFPDTSKIIPKRTLICRRTQGGYLVLPTA